MDLNFILVFRLLDSNLTVKTFNDDFFKLFSADNYVAWFTIIEHLPRYGCEQWFIEFLLSYLMNTTGTNQNIYLTSNNT